jgi:hypothetical protein
MADYSTYYSTDPWSNISTNQRTWYDPILKAQYRRNTVYTGMVPYATQPMLPTNAPSMVFNFAYDFHANTDAASSLRYNEVAPAYMDGFQVQIDFTRYQWASAFDKYDQLISYWRDVGGNQGLSRIIQERVARELQETTDLLIRNAFLGTNFITLASTSYTGADQIKTGDSFTLPMVDQAILRAQTTNVWTEPVPGMQAGDLLCIGTPGQHYDVITSDAATNRWIELRKYRDLTPFNKYEVGSYHSSRHLQTPANVLWNCGKTTVTTNISAAAGPLDGAPDPASTKVDGVYKVGQAGTGATHSITVVSSATFAVGDMVSIHKKKVQSAAAAAKPKLLVSGAPVFDEGTKVERRIVSIPDSTHIVLNKPLLVDFQTEIASTGTGAASAGSGVYGFVTKGVNLHVNIMIAEQNGVVCGVCVPPRVYAPQPIDLFQSVYRVGWDAFWKFQVVRPEAFEVFVTAGTMREASYTYS